MLDPIASGPVAKWQLMREDCSPLGYQEAKTSHMGLGFQYPLQVMLHMTSLPSTRPHVLMCPHCPLWGTPRLQMTTENKAQEFIFPTYYIAWEM